MKIGNLYFPDELYYDENHQWVKTEGDVVTVGITDYARSAAGDVVFVELPRPPLAVRRGQAFGSIESGKWVGRFYAPVGGTVVEVNERLARDPRLLNRDAYGTGWIARIRASTLLEQLERLMRGEAVRTFIEAELERDRLAGTGPGETDGES